MPFNAHCKVMKAEYQLVFVEIQRNNHLLELFPNAPKLKFYKRLSKGLFSKLIISRPKNFCHRPLFKNNSFSVKKLRTRNFK